MAATSSAASSPIDSKRGSYHDLENIAKDKGVHLDGENKICWNEDAKQHPRNWGHLPKFYDAAIICWLEMFMTAISTSGTATAESAKEEYGMSRTIAYFAFVTMYLLGQTIGGICCAPLSEQFGRRTIYIIAASVFCIFSAITAAVPSPITVYFGRFFQGVAAAIPATVAFGSFDDMYNAEHRIWVVYLYTLTGFLGLALGPIYSTYVSAAIGWRWVYYITTIAAGITAGACFFLSESNADQLLDRIVANLKETTGRSDLEAGHGTSSGPPTLSSFVQNQLVRPLRFFATEPLVFFCAALCAIAFGLIYGLTESLTIVYTAPPFNFSMESSSLAFIAIAIGEMLNVLPRIYDAQLLKRLKRDGRRVVPETKIRSFAVSAPALAVGLWIFAWTIPPRVTNVPWPVSMIGLVLIGFAASDFSYVLFGYITDSYGELAASGVGAISMARGLMAAVFPLFTYQMYTGLGPNVAASILAAVASLFALTPFVFLPYGAKLRARSKEALDDEDAMKDQNEGLADRGDATEKQEA